MLGRIILGLIIAAVGALITIKAEWMYQNFGAIPSFDKYLGTSGGSRLGWKIIGILITIIGFMITTNLIGGLLNGIARLFIPSLR